MAISIILPHTFLVQMGHIIRSWLEKVLRGKVTGKHLYFLCCQDLHAEGWYIITAERSLTVGLSQPIATSLSIWYTKSHPAIS